MEEQELLTRPTLERPRTPHMQSACSCSRWIPGRPKRRDREALTRPTCCRSVAVALEEGGGGGWWSGQLAVFGERPLLVGRPEKEALEIGSALCLTGYFSPAGDGRFSSPIAVRKENQQ